MPLALRPLALLAALPAPLAAQWAHQSRDTTTEYRGLAAVSAEVAWASGRGGAWARTADGGTTWGLGRIPGADSLFLIDVEATSPREAVVLGTSFAGGHARIYRTTDAGATWQQAWEARGEGVFYDGMAFVDGKRGVAFGDPVRGRLALARTTDGGSSWTEVPERDRPVMLEGEGGFAASGTAITAREGTVWIGTGAGPRARVLRSTDAGATWTVHETGLPAGPSAGIFGLAFRDGRRGVAVGGDYQDPTASGANLLLTSDGGRTWRAVTGTGLEGVQYGVVHAGGGSYVATNPRGSFVSHDDGATWRRLDRGPWNTASFASGTGWAAGPRGLIGRYIGPPANRAEPSLVVLLTLDQFRNDFLDRYASQWRGGLARLRREGTVYVEGRQDQALTATAPGHAALLSGRYPAGTGIISNSLGVRGAEWPLVTGQGGGASPAGFRGTTLLDWLLARDPGTRSLGVSQKDRSAILPLGRAGAHVYWWGNGPFTTSRWYADSLPSWVQAFNARPWPRALAGTDWTLSRPAREYAEPDSVAWENGGRDVTFPHRLPPDSASLGPQMENYPWMDSLVMALALEGVQQLGLGARTAGPDLLNISLSATDKIGHKYGPESRELHDHLLRLDGWLGTFLDSLEVLVGSRPLVVISSDHGVQPIAEGLVAAGKPGGRTSLRPLAAALRDTLRARWGGPVEVRATTGMIYGDVALLRARGMDVDSLSAALAAQVQRLPGVARVYTPATLAQATDSAAIRWKRQFPADFGWFVAADPVPGWVWYTSTGADHESSVLDDRRVPIVFWGAGVPAARCPGVVPVVDIAPTLAAWLGVMPTEPLDGTPLPLDRCRP